MSMLTYFIINKISINLNLATHILLTSSHNSILINSITFLPLRPSPSTHPLPRSHLSFNPFLPQLPNLHLPQASPPKLTLQLLHLSHRVHQFVIRGTNLVHLLESFESERVGSQGVHEEGENEFEEED